MTKQLKLAVNYGGVGYLCRCFGRSSSTMLTLELCFKKSVVKKNVDNKKAFFIFAFLMLLMFFELELFFLFLFLFESIVFIDVPLCLYFTMTSQQWRLCYFCFHFSNQVFFVLFSMYYDSSFLLIVLFLIPLLFFLI